MNPKAGFTPNATDECSLTYAHQEGSKDAPLSTTDPVAIQRNWAWPWWDSKGSISSRPRRLPTT